MHSRLLCFSVLLVLSLSLLTSGQSVKPQNVPKNGGDFSNNVQPGNKVPTGVILVKGAWSSASDSVTPVPEGGSVANSLFSNQYFGLTYALPPDWFEKYKGPPPSDSGRYALLQLKPADTFKGPDRGTILITAQDMFFTSLPAANALELINYSKDHLQADYKVEMPPTPTKIADRSFTFFAYWSPVAQLHWYILSTQIRCHAVEIVLTSRDTKLLENLVLDMNKMKLPAEASPTAGTGGGAVPVCIADYARDENVITRVEPIFTEHRFNPVPVRIIIDKEGKVKHIHLLSAFPDQAKVITDALRQWKFRPYRRDGQPVEVETGILFGRSAYPTGPSAANPTTE
jgi:Gram-negative bacterial TonB protein C-terminal